MAKRIEVEKSEFINSVIETYTSTKLGQYSKFLDKSHVFVIYLSVNEIMSTSDLGIGNIDNVYGLQSPIRYNRINNLPVYNLPELKPDFDISEDSGADISLDLPGLIVPPGTIRPNMYDSFILILPHTQQLLFRVNRFEFNSIQSNDYYTFDAHLAAKGDNLLESLQINKQIVETYETIFENIGTQNSCFIESAKINEINDLVQTIEILTENYRIKFYDSLTNSFILRNNVIENKTIEEKPNPIQVEGVELPPIKKVVTTHESIPFALYDPYLEKFLSNTQLFNTNDIHFSMCLTENDVLPNSFLYEYQKSIWYAIEKSTIAFSADYMYFYLREVQKFSSPFIMYGIPVVTSYLVEKGYDMYNLDESIKKFRFKTMQDLDREYNQYLEENYTSKGWKSLTNIYNNAKAYIFTTDNEPEITKLKNSAIKHMSEVLTIHDEEGARAIKQILNYKARINPEYYDINGLAQIESITKEHIHLCTIAPVEAFNKYYHMYIDKITQIKRIGEEDVDGTEQMLPELPSNINK